MIDASLIAKAIEANVTASLEEDIGSGDVSSALLPKGASATATITSKSSGVLCGNAWLEATFKKLDEHAQFHWHILEGSHIDPGKHLVDITASMPALLTGERTALNLLQTLSGTATKAANYAKRYQNAKFEILDTRKTLPGLRIAQKYAVWVGGCCNHRLGLYDGVIIKENHIQAYGSITNATRAIAKQFPNIPLIVEAESLDEVLESIKAGVKHIMLDEIPLREIPHVARVVDGRAKLEISGSLDMNKLEDLESLGIDLVSIGDLTKNLQAFDFSMRIGTIPIP